ncbi:AAA family ATPase, partial [Anaerolineales bacterium HSG24]|nr:AAA family ATPase [Anaerolineales bacterium HSG24]
MITSPLATPFNQIFDSYAEAHQAFALLRQTANGLGVNKPYQNPKLALTVSRNALHLGYGGWQILGFERPSKLIVTMLIEHAALVEGYPVSPFVMADDEPCVAKYELPFEKFMPLPDILHHAYQQTIRFIATKFNDWKRSQWWQHHKPELSEALFDEGKRTRLLSEGLPDVELTYEPQRTVFSETIGEEEELYTVNSTSKTPQAISEAKTDYRSPPYPLTRLAQDCYFELVTIEKWLRAIERKGQIIFYGPPGTGKTFLAEKLARHIVGGGDGFHRLIQFHPAYAYEDFMEGLRPELTEQGQLSYSMKSGRFITFCQQAIQRHDLCVLIIDEINRANLAHVFGELMYLLEYRDQSIQLAGGDSFKIPANVQIIGTMNTADRSIALVDHALRRRFAFISLRPNMAVLQRFHQQKQTGFPINNLITVLNRLNQTINDPHYEIGITYFLHEDLSAQLPDIWHTEIEPYLEEYFFSQIDKMQAFR